MENFIFHCPTKIIFGRGTDQMVGQETALLSRRILLHYGSSSIKKTGLYDRVTTALKTAGVSYFELGGVKANPTLDLAQEGIRICREKGIDFILAVGGGSVIDSAKTIAVGVPYQGDVWDFYSNKAQITNAIPIGVVLTIPAAGSEASERGVITREDSQLKRVIVSPFIRPRFAILNPELAYTLPPYQAACGCVDIMSHMLERYFTNAHPVELTDHLIEGGLQTIIHNAPIVLAQPGNYDAWAEIMWTGTLAHNDLMGTGRIGDWATHRIEHEISGIYPEVAHAAGLAMLFPSWMRYVYQHDMKRFVQFATRVWNVPENIGNDETIALVGIDRLEEFWKSLGLATRISAAGISNARFEEMAAKCTENDTRTQGNFVKLNQSDVLKILMMAY